MVLGVLWVFLLLCPACLSHSSRLPVVFIFSVSKKDCVAGLPKYVLETMKHMLLMHPDIDTVLASNFASCGMPESIRNMKRLITLELSEYSSEKSRSFPSTLQHVFTEKHATSELWVTSALRFFQLEDIMRQMNYSQVLHVECDNLLYGNLTELLPFLNQYRGIAATPAISKLSSITASVLWVPSVDLLSKLTDFMLSIGSGEPEFPVRKSYLKWLRPLACCRKGGVDPDAKGNGIYFLAINEMSMLGYFRHLHPSDLLFFPVVPDYSYASNRWVFINISDFGPGGRQIGPTTGAAIWDPGSWGQFLGGTHSGEGLDVGFNDATHIAGQAMRMSSCRPHMLCSNRSIVIPMELTLPTVSNELLSRGSLPHPPAYCWTAPYVVCEGKLPTPLVNLHVHSKHTRKFRSTACDCHFGGSETEK